MKINLYKIGFFIILCLPLVALPPYFFQPDWAKSIIFRSVVAVLFSLYIWKIDDSLNFLIKSFKKSAILWGLATLFLIFFLASIFSIDRLFSFWGSPYRGGGSITFFFLFIFSILLFVKLKKNDWRSAFILCVIIGVLVSLIALIQFYKIPNPIFSHTLAPSATIGNPITLGIYLSILFFIALSFLFVEKNIKWKIFFSVSLFIFANAIFITSSRAAFLGMTIGIIMFILLSPKKNNKLKIGIIVFLAIIFGVISYLNIADAFPKFLEQNKLFNIIAPKLSYQKIINDERFKAWETFSLAIKDRPILGWGPENLAVGFDKFYNPKITQAPWWDKAHNIFLDIGVQAGILGILAYVFLLFALFLSLHKAKRASQDYSEKIVITGIQSALLGYIVANFFSLDSMPSYILFFLIIAYTLNLSLSKEELKSTPLNNKNNIPKKVIMAFVFCVLILFLWQYNYFPLIENGKMNFAEALARNKRCNEAIFLMDEVLNKKNFLYTYAATQYVDLTIACNNFYPEKYQEYIKSGFEIVKEAVKKRPLYTRFWISLGSYANSLAQREQDTDKRSDLLNQAEKYFDMAEKLSPQPPRNNDWKGYNRIGVERLSKNA